MKTHARVRRATSKTPGSIVKARVFFPTPRSAHFVIYVVDKGIYLHVLWCTMLLPHALHAKLDPLSVQTLFPKPHPDAPIKGIQVQSMP